MEVIAGILRTFLISSHRAVIVDPVAADTLPQIVNLVSLFGLFLCQFLQVTGNTVERINAVVKETAEKDHRLVKTRV